jgi:hypothetical protein
MVAKGDFTVAAELIRRQGLAGFISVAPLAVALFLGPIIVIGNLLNSKGSILRRSYWTAVRESRSLALWANMLGFLLVLAGALILGAIAVANGGLSIPLSSRPWFQREIIEVKVGSKSLTCDGYPIEVQGNWLVYLTAHKRLIGLIDVSHIESRTTLNRAITGGLEISAEDDCISADRFK